MRTVMAFLLSSVAVACPIGPTGPDAHSLTTFWYEKALHPQDWPYSLLAWPTRAEVAAEWIYVQGVERANDVMVKP